MPASVFEWHNLILRWIHVLAGVFWIGQTYYFTKLEGRMAADEGDAVRRLVDAGTGRRGVLRCPRGRA